MRPALPWLRLACAVALLLPLLFPIYWMVMTAVMPTADILSRNPSLLPRFASLELAGFATALARHPFLLWTANSLLVSTVSAAISLIVAAGAGYALSRWRRGVVPVAGSALLIGKLVPSALLIIPLFIGFNLIGLIDTYTGLILANVATGVPLAAWLMKGFFDRIPPELEMAAMIDGCTRAGALRHVILPLTRPGLASCAVYLVLVSWSEFIFARTLITSESHTLLTVGLQDFVGEYVIDWQALMAAGTLSMLPIVVLFLLLEPFLVSGMTKGALAN